MRPIRILFLTVGWNGCHCPWDRILSLPSSSLLLIVGQELSYFSTLGIGESLRRCEFLWLQKNVHLKIYVYNFPITVFPAVSFSTMRPGGSMWGDAAFAFLCI